jgi:hypothetical protein
MSIFVKSSVNEITVRNKEVKFIYFPLTGRYSIISPQGALTNLFPLFLVKNNSITLLEEPLPNLSPNWNVKKTHPTLTAFFPLKIEGEGISEDTIQIHEIWDQTDQGLVAEIPLKFASNAAKGFILAKLCIKLYDSLKNAKFVTIYLEIMSWEDFENSPHIHSFVPLAADALSAWELFDYRMDPHKITFFRNGYQSWSVNNLLEYQHKARESAFKIGKNNLENQDNAIKSRYFSEMFTAISDTNSGKSIILGFTTHKRQFNRILMDRMKKKGFFNLLAAISQVDGIPINFLKPRHIKSEELLIFFTSENLGVEGLSTWAEITGKRMESRIYYPPEKIRFKGTLAGYCSWYYYYTKVTEQDMIKNLNFFKSNKGYPVNLIQLDDGYQPEVGDFDKIISEKFPNGMRYLVDNIHDSGYLAGLWIAPFIAQDRSILFKEHPDWFLRDKDDKLILAGINWGSKVYSLDVSKNEVVNHIKSLVQTIIEDWKYDYIKIDFVYASEIIGSKYYIPGMTRAEVYRNGVEFIRDQMGDDALLLGCGAPLGPSIGLVDAMRIGADTAAKWRIIGKIGDFLHYRLNIALPALKPAMLGTILRNFMHNKLWTNDPDCVVVRTNKSKLNIDEIKFQLTVMGLSGGMIMFSDDLTLLEEERLRYMKLLLPPYKERALSIDMLKKRDPELFGLYTEAPIGKRLLLVLLNWKDRRNSIQFKIRDVLTTLNASITTSKFYIFDFWKNRLLPGLFGIDEEITISNIAKHGCVYYSIIPIDPNLEIPIIISSNLHITQGCQEITNVEYDDNEKKLIVEFNLRYHSGFITVLSKTKIKSLITSGRNFKTTKFEKFGYLTKVPVFFPTDKTLTLYFD